MEKKKFRVVTDDAPTQPVLTPQEKAIHAVTGMHEVLPVKVCTSTRFDLVPDLLRGGNRKRKFAMVISLNGIPNFDERPDPLMIPTDLDTFLIDGDTLADLRARAILEIDRLINQIEQVLKPMEELNAETVPNQAN